MTCDSLLEARELAKEAIEGYLESLLKDGKPFPSGKFVLGPLDEFIEISVHQLV